MFPQIFIIVVRQTLKILNNTALPGFFSKTKIQFRMIDPKTLEVKEKWQEKVSYWSNDD